MEHGEEIRKRLESIKGIRIGRIPEKTRVRFIELAKEEFVDDYGLLLKHLIDFYDGLLSTGIEHLEIMVSELRNEVNTLKEGMSKKKEEKPVRTMMNGKKRRD